MFSTKIEIAPSKVKLAYTNKMITLGSCFSENIGQRLQNAGFHVDANPFGILFNPASIKNSLNLLIKKRFFTEEDIFKNGSLWSSFSHSTAFSATEQHKCLNEINQRIEVATKQLHLTDVVLITFGTAWVYQHNDTSKIVSNCHKLPASNFTRIRLTVDEIVASYIPLIEQLQQLNPNIQLIFTVSPIRHWKDGAHENNLSKSILHLAIEGLKEQFDSVHYFPAYEIQLDELRDYRFYAADMLHPSETAIDYIWKRFAETYFSKETLQIKSEVEQLNLQLNHRPINADSEEHQVFLVKLEEKLMQLRHDYPMINL